MKGWDDFSRSPRRGHCGERSDRSNPPGLNPEIDSPESGFHGQKVRVSLVL